MRRKAKGVSLTPAGEARPAPGHATCSTRPASSRPTPGGTSAESSASYASAAIPSLAPTVLPVLLSEFTQAHPEARVEVAENTQDQLTRGLESGELDLAIMYDLDLAGTWRTATLAHLAATGRAAGRPPPRRVRTARSTSAHLRKDPMVLLDAPPSSSHAYECCAKAGLHPERRLPRPHLRDGPLLRRPRARLDPAAPAAQRQRHLRGRGRRRQGHRLPRPAAGGRRARVAAGLAAEPGHPHVHHRGGRGWPSDGHASAYLRKPEVFRPQTSAFQSK